MKINYTTYLDKVRGCWAGKNIGGTLGAPMEGNMNMQNVSFYTQELNGVPAPNDDLDLQLVWLGAVETHGIDQITPRLLGEYWDQCIIAPCSEYSVCKMNIANGFMPPLSGAVNNDRFKYSNGAWIRSELWACLCPGAPDEAIRFGYIDSCADHCEEGIWAEMFTCALEATAFVCDDVRKIIEIALCKIPADSELAKAVCCAIECYDKKMPWQEARQKLMSAFNIKTHRAAVNIGFVIIGLLYGEGDFDRSICTAVNCGDDTDCTGATVGALFGIMRGRSGIPKRWLDPIGESITTICINHFPFNFLYGLPKTLEALSQRTLKAALAFSAINPLLPVITRGESQITDEEIESLKGTDAAQRLWKLPLYYQDFALPWTATLRVEFPTGPITRPGETLPLRFYIGDSVHVNAVFSLRFKNLPENWSAEPAALACALRADCQTMVETQLKVGDMNDIMTDWELDIAMVGRRQHHTVLIPVQHRGTVSYNIYGESNQSYRCRTRIEAGAKSMPCLDAGTPQA